MKSFYCFWSADAFVTKGNRDRCEIKDETFFTDDRGYTDDDRKAINGLEIGQKWEDGDYGDMHTVTRFA